LTIQPKQKELIFITISLTKKQKLQSHFKIINTNIHSNDTNANIHSNGTSSHNALNIISVGEVAFESIYLQ